MSRKVKSKPLNLKNLRVALKIFERMDRERDDHLVIRPRFLHLPRSK